MSLKISLNNINSNTSPQTGGSSGKTYGRVIDVILNENHPSYFIKGGGVSINGVFYKPTNSVRNEQTPSQLSFAYQGGAQVKVVPLVGEVVQIESLPTPSDNGFTGQSREYYTGVVNIWNSPNSNFYPNVLDNLDIDFSQNSTFKELATVNPIGSTPGDIQLEGRQGQSIRFTGGKGFSNPWVDSTNIGKPVIIISNGQKETEDGFTTIGEDINEDDCSIYMVSDHQIPLNQASSKRDSWDTPPITADQFKGNQVIINGGRLFFNAKEEDILLSSVNSIGLNAQGTVNIDSTQFTCIDGSKIFLGAKARTAPGNRKEPVLLGNQTENLLKTLFNMLEGMATDMGLATTIDGKPIPLLNQRGIQMKVTLQVLKRQINPNGPSSIKSKKVFTE